ncbi:MAG: hypothetical protein K1X83_06550 [Oligoflexia bacterium]|nr:hypothetical protein [Oligoflexia bacterium]
MGARGSKGGNNKTRISAPAATSAGAALPLPLRGSNNPAVSALPGTRQEMFSSASLLIRLEQFLHNPTPPADSNEDLQNIYLLLTEFLFRRTGETGFLEAFRVLQQQLWAEPHIVELCGDICKAFEARRRNEARVQSAETLEDLRSFVAWLRKRLRSVARLGSEELDEDERAPGDVHIFEVQLSRDVQWFGYPGLEIRLGIKISGMRGQNLMLRCRLKDFKGYVRVRAGWESWSEDRALNIAASMVAPRFALQSPIHVTEERFLIDEFRIFLPLEALALENTENLLSLEIEVLSQTGERLAEGEERVTLRAVELREARLSLPAPQAVRFLETDSASGSYLRIQALQRVYRLHAAEVCEALRFGVDLCMAGAAHEIFTISCRILDHDLLAVGEDILGTSANLLITAPLRSYSNYQLELPLSGLPAELQISDCYAEVTMSRSDGRVVCGAVVPCSALHADVPVTMESYGALLEWDHAQIERLEIEPSIEWKGEQAVRAAVSIKNLSVPDYRVMLEYVTGEPESGPPRVLRQLYCLAADSYCELLSCVSAAVLAGLITDKSCSKARFHLRVLLISPSDRVLACQTKSFNLAINAAAQAPIPASAVGIVEVKPLLAARAAPVFEARLDLEMVPEIASGLMLYYELSDRNGKPVMINQGVQCIDGVLPGAFLEIPAAQLPALHGAPLGRRQIVVRLEPFASQNVAALFSDFSLLRLLLFSKQGQLLDRIGLPLHSVLDPLAESVERAGFFMRVARVFGVGLI